MLLMSVCSGSHWSWGYGRRLPWLEDQKITKLKVPCVRSKDNWVFCVSSKSKRRTLGLQNKLPKNSYS